MCFGASRTEWWILTNLWIVPEWWVSFSVSLKTFKCVQQQIIKFVVGRSWAEVSWAAAYDSWEFQTPGGRAERACWSSNFLLSRMTGVFDVWRILRGSYEAALLGLCIDLSILISAVAGGGWQYLPDSVRHEGPGNGVQTSGTLISRGCGGGCLNSNWRSN